MEFKLKEDRLLYRGKDFIVGGDNIVKFFTELAVTTPPELTKLNLSQEEEEQLEDYLAQQILEKGKFLKSDIE